MENVLWYIFRIWTNRPAQLLLYGSFLVHYGLALYALWQRRTLRLRGSELSQLVLGFAIPLLLVRHVVVTRISDSFSHTDVGYYAYLLWVYFVRSPDHGFVQMLVLVVAWGHAMIGLHFWLRVRAWYARLQSAALIVAVLVPVLSLLGAIEAGRQVMALAVDPNWIGDRITLPSAQTQRILETITEVLTWLFAGMVGAVLLARFARRAWQRRRGLVRIGYPDGHIVEVTPGTSVLEASRLAGIPHASVCGGRGRCSTCRIRVRGAAQSLDPPGEDEPGARRGLLGNHELAGKVLGQAFEAARGIDGITDRGYRGNIAIADLSDNGRPAMNTYADTQWPIEFGSQRSVQFVEPR